MSLFSLEMCLLEMSNQTTNVNKIRATIAVPSTKHVNTGIKQSISMNCEWTLFIYFENCISRHDSRRTSPSSHPTFRTERRSCWFWLAKWVSNKNWMLQRSISLCESACYRLVLVVWSFSSVRNHQYHRINCINRQRNNGNYQIFLIAALNAYRTQYSTKKKSKPSMEHSHCKSSICLTSANRHTINCRNCKTKKLKWEKNSQNSNKHTRRQKSE